MSRKPICSLTITCAILALLPASALAVQPSLSAIQPKGIQRGIETEVVFRGARLEDAEELMLYSPGIEVLQLTAENTSTVKATLKAAADCRLGIHAVRLRSKSGVSNLRTFTVGALPNISEVEPNNEFAAPQAIDLNSTVNGVVLTEDVDYFVVEAKQGDRITAELEGLRLGKTFFDPYLAILNSERFELARSDDDALLFQDCLCSIVAPKDGKYIIQVRESSFGGDGNCTYRLHVGNFPRPTGVLPAGGRPGETVEMTWIGDAGGRFTTKVTLPADAEEDHELFSQDAGGIAPSPNVVRVVDLDNFIEVEPNDARTEATAAAGPGALNGIIEKAGDVDHFKFAAKKGQSFDIRVYARQPLRSPLDSVLNVYRLSNGARVGSNDDSGGPDSYLRFSAPDDDEYVVEIQDHLKAGGPKYVYRIEIAPIRPQLTMVLPEVTRYVSTTLTVPRGNRMALMVNATRAGFGGELQVSAENLPPGITLETVPMAANRSDVPVLFTAAADASPAGALADLIGKPTDEKLDIVGHLKQRTLLVRGQNNRDVWGHDALRMAVSLAEEVPYTIEIVQPKVPLVRNGSMGLKVVAKRQEGFTAPISIQMLYNPPGVGSSRSITIAEGKNEAEIPITANGGATIQKWPIVVLGSSRVGNGTVEVASQMAELDVADRFFDFAFQKTAVEQGQETTLVVNVTKRSDFAGTAQVQLLGLPAGTSTEAEPVEITQDSTEMVFKVKAEATTRPNTYKSLVCRAVLVQNEEPITTTLGTGELRVDKPLPPKVDAPAPASKPAAPAAVAVQKPVVEKRLSRLEQLRLERAKQLEAEKKE